jgi:thymidylate synthase ThyX
MAAPAPSRYSEAERRLLSFYFTSLEPREHGDIYLVRNLPEEVRATLNGLYSRSHLSMRDALLSRLKKGLEEKGLSLEALAIPEARPDQAAEFLAERSGKFLKTYAIDHGHNSLREGSVLHFAVENVSQLVTRFLQRERRCSFEESSTRYISFSAEGHWRDPEVYAAAGPERELYERTIQECFGLYDEATRLLIAHIRKLRPCGAGEKPDAYERACRSEALDASRYLLLPALYTKFGVVVDARTLSDLVQQLMSHPLAEFRQVGDRLLEQGNLVARTLLSHARAVPYLQHLHAQLPQLALAVAPPAATPRDDAAVRLLACDPLLDDRLLASLLYEHSQEPLATLLDRVRALPDSEKDLLFDRILGARGPHDAMPAGLEGAQPCEFECLVDFGAYRDIGRHRRGFQQMQALTCEHGFAVPPLIEEAGLLPRYREALLRAADAFATVRKRFLDAAAYLVPFAFLQRVRIVFDPRQVGYFVELRSAPEGHFSYRQVAIAMFEQLAAVAPRFARFVRVQKGQAFLGRMQTEQTAEDRRERRMQQAGDA